MGPIKVGQNRTEKKRRQHLSRSVKRSNHCLRELCCYKSIAFILFGVSSPFRSSKELEENPVSDMFLSRSKMPWVDECGLVGSSCVSCHSRWSLLQCYVALSSSLASILGRTSASSIDMYRQRP